MNIQTITAIESVIDVDEIIALREEIGIPLVFHVVEKGYFDEKNVENDPLFTIKGCFRAYMRIEVDIGNKDQPEHFHKVILGDEHSYNEKSTLSEIQKAHQLALEDSKRFYEDYNKQK